MILQCWSTCASLDVVESPRDEESSFFGAKACHCGTEVVAKEWASREPLCHQKQPQLNKRDIGAGGTALQQN